jgi:BirA family biotin operon repressor/biotin-[acetyl-CoA-carboxylase] ligase
VSAHELAPEAVLPRLVTRRYGRSLELRETTDSTNDDAKQAATNGAALGHVVVADAQTRGRGSQGRDWSSPSGEDLYLSIVERPPVPVAALPPLTLAVGLGVAEAVDRLLGREHGSSSSRVKWPNDVQLDGKKCAGVLIEATASGSELASLVIGIGLNVNRSAFPSDLADSATSLRLSHPSRQRFDRAQVLGELLARVETWVERFCSEGAEHVVRALSDKLALRDQRAVCGEVRGIVRGVSPSGALRMETPQGMRELIAGRLLPDL